MTSINADILILTETHQEVHVKGYNQASTLPLSKNHDGIDYRPGEYRTSILSRYPIINSIPTNNPYTNVAVEVATPTGVFTILGTIIGILGKSHPSFKQDLKDFISDVQMLAGSKNLLIGGDFNTSFCDSYYYTKEGRHEINSLLADNFIDNTTAGISENIDHIAISRGLIADAHMVISEFNKDKKLSDHKGVVITLNLQSHQ